MNTLFWVAITALLILAGLFVLLLDGLFELDARQQRSVKNNDN